MRRNVIECVEARLQFDHVLTGELRWVVLATFFVKTLIAQVTGLAVSSADIPAAPTLVQWAAVVGDESTKRRNRITAFVRVDRTHDKARHIARAVRNVTLQTLVIASKAWLL